MIGVVGLGQCGGNIASEAQERGFLSCSINFSQKDLDAVDVKHKLKLQGSEGVGKDRRVAIELFQDQWETALKFVQERFSGVDAIVFAFSSSGGSGSGIAPIFIDIVKNMMPEKVISAFVVIPDLSEVPVSQANCLETFEELSRLGISIFPIDNQQARNFQQIGKNKVYEYTNKKSIDLLKKLVDYTDRHSKYGNFDKRDFLTVLNTAGTALISETDIANIERGIEVSSEWVSKTIQDSFSESVFTPSELGKVSKAAIIFDAQEALMEFIDHNKIFSCFSNGAPIELFDGNYADHNGKVMAILSGLGWCSKRLRDIELSMNIDKDRIESTLIEVGSYKSGAGDLLSKIKKQPEPSSRSITDIISKYKR